MVVALSERLLLVKCYIESIGQDGGYNLLRKGNSLAMQDKAINTSSRYARVVKTLYRTWKNFGRGKIDEFGKS